MHKPVVTILLIGLMCISLVNSLTVICHGSDGHFAVEPLIHNHCGCSGSDHDQLQAVYTEPPVEISADHEHCTDSLASHSLLLSREKVKFSKQFFIVNQIPKSLSVCISPASNFTVKGDEFSSFHTPLQSTILLV